MYILTFDVEEWFHLLDNDSTKTEKEWRNYEVRIYDNMERIFRILEDTHTSATFFVIGWIAKTYPDIVKRIAEKYEIGSHTMNHQLVWQQKQAEFKKDVYASVNLLEDITGKPVKYFRAPGFSIRESEPWAFETIQECGIEYDCSVFPAHHAHGGFPSYGKSKPSILVYGGKEIKEFPINTKSIFGKPVIFSGGGYFRLLPYRILKQWTQESNDYLISYIHPRDLDAGQPIIRDLPLIRKFKSYVGLHTAETKMRRWLSDFQFVDLSTAAKEISWESVPKIHLK
ncbi:polysaccharide deacetylase family protein [Alistipes sp. D31t1_170403_E11]|jgi:polysaccharide deacetylase family protein (PEP-CTERM system associated)|uniref:polysaccharide deacetylase family protein n=1 Tax=Alistipes sp. D31t1_170403_E11 TaxID=2787128 RepID=UPI00189C1519|nr:polysaccharide deacetylase family protein [Alistipes sp. D31t1_170403_E11]